MRVSAGILANAERLPRRQYDRPRVAPRTGEVIGTVLSPTAHAADSVADVRASAALAVRATLAVATGIDRQDAHFHLLPRGADHRRCNFLPRSQNRGHRVSQQMGGPARLSRPPQDGSSRLNTTGRLRSADKQRGSRLLETGVLLFFVQQTRRHVWRPLGPLSLHPSNRL